MAKNSRAAAAARGTKADPARVAPAADECAGKPESVRPMSVYERRTSKIFTIAEVVLVVVPLATIGYVWLAGGGSMEGFQEALGRKPSLAVSFISAMCQPLVAWLLRFVHDRCLRGDGGYAAANLIALICGELLLQNIVGVIGCAVLLWRIWRRVAGELAAWRSERRLGGMLADLSGAIVVIAIGLLCAFATWRIGLA